MEPFNKSALNTLLKRYREKDESLILLLQNIQNKFGYLPRQAMQYVSRTLEIPLSKLFSITTFYSTFSLEPPGKNSINVCLGTACHVNGGENLSNMLGRELRLDAGEGTTSDRAFTLKKVRCLGCCSMAPVVKINEDIHGHMTQTKTGKILKQYRKDGKR